MLKNIVSGILFSAIIIGLSGCGPAQMQVKPMSNLSVSERTNILKLNFPEADPVTGEKIMFDLNQYNFSNQIIKMSDYSAFHMTRGGDVSRYRGLKVNKSLNSYILDYANGEHINNSWYLNSAKFTLYFKKLNDKQISFTLDDKYKYQACSNAIGIDIDPLDSLQNLENDSKTILSKLGTLKIILNRRYHFTGDVNSKYHANSIYANFKRLAGTYNWHSYYGSSDKEKLTEVKKENSFNLKVNGVYIPLHVEVYPYRNGSKVQYEAYIPYTISSNGNVTLSKNDIEKLKTEISKIIND
jgi:hypothetical protein